MPSITVLLWDKTERWIGKEDLSCPVDFVRNLVSPVKVLVKENEVSAEKWNCRTAIFLFMVKLYSLYHIEANRLNYLSLRIPYVVARHDSKKN